MKLKRLGRKKKKNDLQLDLLGFKIITFICRFPQEYEIAARKKLHRPNLYSNPIPLFGDCILYLVILHIYI